MMKKARKVMTNQSPTPFVYPEDRERIKIRSLMVDYGDLVKETDAVKKRLQEAKKKRQNLLAQVKFLRRKYKSLMHNPPQNNLYQPDLETQYSGPSTSQAPMLSPRALPAYTAQARLPDAKTRATRKAKGPRETVFPSASPIFDLNQTVTPRQHQLQKSYPEFATQSTESPAKEKNHYLGKEIMIPNRSAVLDLNQAATPTADEVDYRFAWEAPASEQPSRHYATEAAGDHAAADVKLAACRNIGKTTNRNGKRKISWQDQMALRV